MSNIPSQIKDSIIVVVGASSGFGRGAASELAKQGAKVVVAARRGELLDELVAQITAEGGTAVAAVTDVSVENDVTELSRLAVETFGRIDVWINNVGVGAIGYFCDIPVDVHARVV